MKVAILVDSLTNKGGVQRVVLLLAKIFNADIYTGRYNLRTTFSELNKFNIKVIGNKKLPFRLGSLFLKHKFKRLKLNYDFYIFLGGEALGAAKKNKPNLWWCCTPRIWLYYTTKRDLAILGFLKRNIIRLLLPLLRFEDKFKVKHVENIVSISENVRQRVKKIYNRDTKIIYPFVDIATFRYIKSGDFYLSTARLTPDKRVDVIVEAFKEMPDKRLIVASGGCDLEKIKKLAKGCKNIEVLGWVSDKKLAELYGNCLATIAASYFEDFGMIAIESMAAGKPVIAPGDKGFAETVIDGKTGFLIDPTKKNIVEAVKKLTSKKAKEMRNICEKRAKLFSKEKFIKDMKNTVNEILNSYEK